MNRAVSGSLTVLGTGRPLRGLRVLAARLVDDGLEPLGTALTGDFGRFRISYEPLCGPADLTLLVFSQDGRLLFTEPVHRSIGGAELCLQVEIPRSAISEGLH